MHSCQNGTTSASFLLLSLLYLLLLLYFVFLFSFSIFSLVFFPLAFVQALYFYSFPGNKYVPGDSNILLTSDTLCDLVPFVHLKKRENTHGGVLLLGKLQAILKVTLLNGCFSGF